MTATLFSAQPADQGLYSRAHEHDACGVAFVATMRGSAGHDIVAHALDALRNLDHRGATGADPLVGDGAGILTQVPDAFLREVVDFALPPAGRYAVGMAYLPREASARVEAIARIGDLAREEGLGVLGWRDVPATIDIVGTMARECMPWFAQVFVTSLDSFFEGRDMRTLKAIKMDAEGAEFAILVGSRELLRRARIPFIIAEINRYGLESMGASERHVRALMTELGYETYLFQPGQSFIQRLQPDETPQTDYVFNVLFRHPDAPALAAA